MSMKKLAMLTAFAGLAMAAGGMGYMDEPKPKRRTLNLNERRKCFHKPCKNMRPNAIDLYCCEECKTRARESNK